METDCEMLTLNQRSHCLSILALASTRVTHFINAQTSSSLNAERKRACTEMDIILVKPDRKICCSFRAVVFTGTVHCSKAFASPTKSGTP